LRSTIVSGNDKSRTSKEEEAKKLTISGYSGFVAFSINVKLWS